MVDCSYCTFEDGGLRMRGLHRHDFPMLLWDALVQIGYGEEVPAYRGQFYEEHGSTKSKVCPVVRSTVTSHSTPCFPMGARGPRGSLETIWTTLCRRLLTWRSPPYAHSACLTLMGHALVHFKNIFDRDLLINNSPHLYGGVSFTVVHHNAAKNWRVIQFNQVLAHASRLSP
jgi:hypothetical protein